MNEPKKRMLPVVFLSLAAASSISATVAPYRAAAVERGRGAIPIAAAMRASNDRRVPDALARWTNAKAHDVGFPAYCDVSRCLTVSGSFDGWDDSQDDC
jgi:hypothetical protein